MKGQLGCVTCDQHRFHAAWSGVIILLLSTQGTGFLSPPACPSSLTRQFSKARYTAVVRRVVVTGGGAKGQHQLDVDCTTVGPTATAVAAATTPTFGTMPQGGKSAATENVTGKETTSSAQPSRLPADLEKDNEKLRTHAKKEGSARPSGNQPGIDRDMTKNDAISDTTDIAKGKGVAKIVTDETSRERAEEANAAVKQKPVVARSWSIGDNAVEPPDAARVDTTEGINDVDSKILGKKTVSRPTKKKNVADPETTAAEKVLTLLELGLVDKEDVTTYYEALANLERTTREAKEATTLAMNKSAATATTPVYFPGKQDPASLVPFPAICAALGAAGMHSLQLSSDADTIASVCGGTAGAVVGGLLVIGDDPVGGFARAAGAAVARAIGFAGGWAGKEVSATAAGAAGAAVSAAEEALVKAPANAAAAVGRSILEIVSLGVAYVLGLPGQLARNTFEGVKGTVINASETAVSLPGGLAKKAADVAGETIQNTSEAAVSAVKVSPKEASKKLQEVVDTVSSPDKIIEAATSLLKRSSSRKVEQAGPAAAKVGSAVTSMGMKPASEANGDKDSAGIAAEELEAKMSSVQEALERFDAVKSRIENARTSATLREAMSMTRNLDPKAVREQSGDARSVVAETEENMASRRTRSPSPAISDKPKPIQKPESLKIMDDDRRKRIAENLLGKASQGAQDARATLKMAVVAARESSDCARDSAVAPPDTGVTHATPTE